MPCGQAHWGALVAGLVFFLLLAAPPAHGQQGFTALWWNVENLFDTQDDPLTADDEFTPTGDRHWTPRRLSLKLDAIGKAIARAGLPDVVGLCEVENARVLDELCHGSALAQAGYRFVHYDSPDRRGIDCALLYRPGRFRPLASRAIGVSDTAHGFRTRDLLLVQGLSAQGDTLCLFVCHLPSRRGGSVAEWHRMAIAQRLAALMDSVHRRHPHAAVLAMGDMNAPPADPAIAQGMGFGADSVSPSGIVNLTLRLPQHQGTYRYQGLWEYLDAMFLLADSNWRTAAFRLVDDPELLTPESRHLGHRPHRTYRGPVYEGGASDHLPLLIALDYVFIPPPNQLKQTTIYNLPPQ